MKGKYKIGEVSKLLGISSDAIRLYEKKNIIKPFKDKNNGYRYYSTYDIYTLMDIIFYRKINISLDNISKIMCTANYNEIKKIVNNKEIEIENEIKKQNIYLKKLRSLKNGFNLVEKHLNNISLVDIEKIHILCELDPNALKNIFDLDKKHFDLYQLTSKIYIKNNNFDTAHHYLTVEEETLLDFNLKSITKSTSYLDCKNCVYTILKAKANGISYTDIQGMLAYINKHNIKAQDHIFTNYIFTVVENNEQINYIEVFLPIA